MREKERNVRRKGGNIREPAGKGGKVGKLHQPGKKHKNEGQRKREKDKDVRMKIRERKRKTRNKRKRKGMLEGKEENRRIDKSGKGGEGCNKKEDM